MSALDRAQWAEVQRLFALASQIPPPERAAFLECECPDAAVAAEVRSLLDYSAADLHTAAGSIAAQASSLADAPDQRLIGARLGPYRMEAIIGHGGMGAVYRAFRDDGEFHQQVAIKLVRAAAQNASTLERFKQERQILARLVHPNIAHLLDGGSTPEGIPYLVMEFIAGEPIMSWSDQQSLTRRQRLRLFLSVCQAVEFAHSHQVVHRDLKPANILVTVEGIPKLLDFGIAKTLGNQSDIATATNMQAMTPEYAAPEQVLGGTVSGAVDVYALGLILYELLTGHKAQSIADPTPATVAKAICHTEPIAPSVWNPELSGDLDNIIRMAIRKEPERRYASVADFARDIQLHLDGRPVMARRDTAAYRITKFLRRNRAAVTAAALTAILFAAIALASRLRAPVAPPRVLRVTQITDSGRVGSNGGLATDGSYVYFREETPNQLKFVRASVDGGSPQALFNALVVSQIQDISPDRTTLLFINGTELESPLWIISTSGGPVHRVGNILCHVAAWSPDGKSIVYGRGHGVFQINPDGSGIEKLAEVPNMALDLRWSPRGDRLRYNVRSEDGHRANLFEYESGEIHPLLATWKPRADCSPSNSDGQWMAGGRYFVFRSFCGSMYSFWTLAEGRRPFQPPSQPAPLHSTSTRISRPVPSPDGKRIFFISEQQRRELVRYDAARREFVPYLRGVPGHWVSSSKDGKWLAYTTTPGEVLWRSRADGSQAVQLTPASLRAYMPVWSPDGAWILFTGFTVGQKYGNYVIPSSGGAPQRLTPAANADDSPAWSPDGASIMFHRWASPEQSGLPGLYMIDWKTRKISFISKSEQWSLGAWSPDGRRLAVTGKSQLFVYDLHTRRLTELANGVDVIYAAWSRDGRSVYYQDLRASETPILRAPIDGGPVERVAGPKQIPQSDWNSYAMVGLAPDDSPIASLVRDNSDVYDLELELP